LGLEEVVGRGEVEGTREIKKMIEKR